MARPRLLVVDDEPGMLRAIERILAPSYDVRSARLPSQALELAGVSPIDVAILDVRMPEMDGFALMARLTALQPGLDVILMTGSMDERDARLVRAIREKAFFFLTKPFDRDVLLTLVERCLELRRLDAENRVHVQQLESELSAARLFQERLLPERRAAAHGLRVALHWEPSEALCGDFFDYVLGEPASTVLIADVSGHGASAAMLTGMMKLAYRASAADAYDPARVMERLRASGTLFETGKHVTALCARITPKEGTLEYVNAGHPPGLRLRADGAVERLGTSAPLVHPFYPDWTAERRSVSFEPGDLLLLYTDGIIEARNAANEEFGAERLEAAVCAGTRSGRTGVAMLAALREAVGSFAEGRPVGDDLTMAVVEAVFGRR